MNRQKIEIIGRCTAKPEVKKSKSKKDYAKLGVAVNSTSKDENGKEQEKATFYNVLIFDKRAKTCEKLKKGQQIIIIGNLDANAYLSKDGEARVDLTVLANEFFVLDSEIFKS